MNYLPCSCIAFYFQDLGSWTVLNDQFVKFHKNNHSDCFKFMLIVNLLANACLRCLNDVSIGVCSLSSFFFRFVDYYFLVVILIVTLIYKSTPSYNDYFYTHKYENNLELCKILREHFSQLTIEFFDISCYEFYIWFFYNSSFRRDLNLDWELLNKRLVNSLP